MTPWYANAIGTNLYAWCGNNPVSREDPSGMAWNFRSIGAHLMGGVGAAIGAFIDYSIGFVSSWGGGGGYSGYGYSGGYYKSRGSGAAKKAKEIVKSPAKLKAAVSLLTKNSGRSNYACASGLLSRNNTSDLGTVGNFIRGQVKSDFGKELFENYWNSGGDIELSNARFSDIIKSCVSESDGITVALSNGTWGKKQTLNCYDSPEYALAIGRGTIYSNKAGFVGFADTYDFDAHGGILNSDRSWDSELYTQATAGAGYLNGATGFSIHYGVTEYQ